MALLEREEARALAQLAEAMPAELPPTSGYTYAVDFSVDEALEAGARVLEQVYSAADNIGMKQAAILRSLVRSKDAL